MRRLLTLLGVRRAQMERANGGGSDERWANIRANFLKANALDKEDAEPLLLFYQSYARAGQAATKNAKDGLDYALVLAPQDDGLRLTAAYQQLLDKRVKEARQSLLPLACMTRGFTAPRSSTTSSMSVVSDMMLSG